jgi:hypothetical protein
MGLHDLLQGKLYLFSFTELGTRIMGNKRIPKQISAQCEERRTTKEMARNLTGNKAKPN